jgi:hypothetical protein
MTSPAQGFGGGQQWKQVVAAPQKFTSVDATPIVIPLFRMPDDNTLKSCFFNVSGVDSSEGDNNNVYLGMVMAQRDSGGSIGVTLNAFLNFQNGTFASIGAVAIGDLVSFVITPPAIDGYLHAFACMDRQDLP